MLKEEGLGSLLLGFRPTMAGYVLQGAAKFGLFELFKASATERLGQERAANNAMAIYLASSASAETLASVLLCPFEALRIRKVGNPTYPTGILDGLRTVTAQEGVGGYVADIIELPNDTLACTVVYLPCWQSNCPIRSCNLLPSPSLSTLRTVFFFFYY